MFQTLDPSNKEERYTFEVVSSAMRMRSDPSKFSSSIVLEEVKEGNKGQYNKLGYDWSRKYSQKGDWVYFFPTLNEILKGLKEQEFSQQLLNSGLQPSSQEFQEALKNGCEAWDSTFEEITDYDFDTRLTKKILMIPNHQVTEFILYLYTEETWLYSELNSGSREGSKSKIETLGPYAKCFG